MGYPPTRAWTGWRALGFALAAVRGRPRRTMELPTLSGLRMDYRSLLVHLDDGDDAACLELAASLAARFDAELAGTYLVPTRELTPFTSAMLPDAVIEHRLRDTGDAQARAEARFREVAVRHALAKVA